MLKSREIYVVTFIFILGVIGHFFAADFLKAMAVYPDEIRYLLPAQSLFEGYGNVINNQISPYQKIGYSLFLAPFFAIDDVVLRLRCISLLNSFLIMCPVFFAYMLAKEFKLKTRDVYLSVLFSAILPISFISISFMSETLYYPLFMAFVYLFVLYERKKDVKTAVLLGGVCYYGYLTKEVFLSLLIAAVLTEVWGIFCERKNILYVKQRCRLLLCFFGTYLALFTLVKWCFFAGLGNSYDQMGTEPVSTWEGIKYLIYTLAYYTAAMFVCYYVLPPIMVAVVSFRADVKLKRFILFVGLIGVIAAVAVSYTILIRENAGLIIPRLHTRYIEPLFLPIFILFLKALDMFRFKKDGKLLIYLVLGVLIFICAIFKGTIYVVAIDQESLYWYVWLRDKIGFIRLENGEFLFTGVWLVNLFIVLFTTVSVYMLKTITIERFKYCCAAFLLVMMSVNNVIFYHTLKKEYGVTAEQAQEMQKLNDYFADKEGSIAYFSNHPNHIGFIFDTYFKKKSQLFALQGWDLLRRGDADEFVMSKRNLYDTWLYEPYLNLDNAEWIILDNAIRRGVRTFANTQYIPEASGKMFSVYRNLSPELIKITRDESLFYNGGDFHVYVDDERCNAQQYFLYGISESAYNRGWADSDKFGISIPSHISGGKVRVEIEVEETFENQSFNYKLSHGDEFFDDGVIQGKGVIEFELPIENYGIYFEVTILNAEPVFKFHPFEYNTDKTPLKIKEIRIYPANTK